MLGWCFTGVWIISFCLHYTWLICKAHLVFWPLGLTNYNVILLSKCVRCFSSASEAHFYFLHIRKHSVDIIFLCYRPLHPLLIVLSLRWWFDRWLWMVIRWTKHKAFSMSQRGEGPLQLFGQVSAWRERSSRDNGGDWCEKKKQRRTRVERREQRHLKIKPNRFGKTAF